MRISSLPRRSLAAVLLAVLLLSSASIAGAVAVQGGAACESMAAMASASGPAGHACEAPPPPTRMSGCSNAPCCVLTPDGAEPAARALPVPPSSGTVDVETPSGGSVVGLDATATVLRSDPARSSSGRARLALHSVLLI